LSLINTSTFVSLPYMYRYGLENTCCTGNLYSASLNLSKNLQASSGNLYNSFIHLPGSKKSLKESITLPKFNVRNLEVSLPLLKTNQTIKDYSLLSTFITNLSVVPFRTKTRFSFSKIPYFSSLDTYLFSPTSTSFKPSHVSNPYMIGRLKQNVRSIYSRFHKNIKYNLFSVCSGLRTVSRELNTPGLKAINGTFKKLLKFTWSKRSSIQSTTFLANIRSFTFRPKLNKLNYRQAGGYKFNTRKSYLRLKTRVKKRKFNSLRFKLKSSLRSRTLIDNNINLINYNHQNCEDLSYTDYIPKSLVLNDLASTKKNSVETNTSLYSYALRISNPLLYKLGGLGSRVLGKELNSTEILPHVGAYNPLDSTNLKMSNSFRKVFKKKAFDYYSMCSFSENVIPIYHNTLIRFLEHSTGSPVIIQFYPFMYQSVTFDWAARYRYWLPRMRSYERSLGHKFFLEEALHIMHLAFSLRDSKLFSSWLKAIILRISFWRTRSIFRFLKYLMISHFSHVFSDLKVKGLKIKLKGKISVAGNSRKRSILYRVGKTSHSELSLRVDHTKTTVNTFTGVMGFQVWIFY